MRITYAATLSLAVVLVGTAAGCASDSDKAVQVVSSFYEAAARGDCATAVTYTSPTFQAGSDGGAARACTLLKGYQIVHLEAQQDKNSDGPPVVAVELSEPGYPDSTQGATLVRGPHGYLIESISGTT